MNPQLSIQKLAARKLLASMPDDVFNIYITPLIEAHGWPFHVNGSVLNPPEVRRWFQMFDHQFVQAISQLTWERRKIPFALARFHPRSYEVVAALINLHVFGVNTFVAPIANTREKFFSARAYIAETGTMPVPVILQHDLLGLRILDGNHRLAAMASFSNANDGIIDCWLGRFTPVNTPLPNITDVHRR